MWLYNPCLLRVRIVTGMHMVVASLLTLRRYLLQSLESTVKVQGSCITLDKDAEPTDSYMWAICKRQVGVHQWSSLIGDPVS